MKYMTTSKYALPIVENGLIEFLHVHGAGHHHYLVEAESEEKLAPLKAYGASWHEVANEEYAWLYLENHPRGA